MTNFKNFFKQNLRLVLAIVSGVLIIAGILTMLFGNGATWLKIAFIALGVVLILLGCSILVLAFALGSSEKANFFLYDSKRKCNVSLDELDFARVDKKMTYIMMQLTSNASEVWTGNVFEKENEIFAEGNTTFVPLVAYKVLYDLCEHANENIWNLYVMADESVIDAIVSALDLNGDSDLGNAFKFLYKNSAGSYERTKKFLSDNKKYIQNKMLKYVRNNISRF